MGGGREGGGGEEDSCRSGRLVRGGGASSGSVGWWWVPFIVQCSGRALLPSQNANNLQDIVFHYSKRPREPRELRPASERSVELY